MLAKIKSLFKADQGSSDVVVTERTPMLASVGTTVIDNAKETEVTDAASSSENRLLLSNASSAEPDHLCVKKNKCSRFETEGPFFATLKSRNWHCMSLSSWNDFFYLLYTKIRAFFKSNTAERLIGISCAILSSFFLSVGFALSKTVNDHVDAVALYAWRQTFLVVFTIPMTRYYDKPFFFHWKNWKAWGQLLLRTVFGSLNIYCVFKALTYISLTDATVVSTTAPIFASLFAYCILGEKIGIVEVLCCAAVIVGVFLSSQPAWLFHPSLLAQGDVVQRLTGLGVALCGAVSGAFSTVLMRSMRSIHFSTVQIIYAYLSVVLTWPIVAICGYAQLPPCSYDKKSALTLIGLTALPMQAFYIIACQREKAGVVSVARASTPVFSFIWQLAFFGNSINAYSMVGDLIVMCSIVGLALKKVQTGSSGNDDRDKGTTSDEAEEMKSLSKTLNTADYDGCNNDAYTSTAEEAETTQ